MTSHEPRPDDFRSWVDGTHDAAAERIYARIAESVPVAGPEPTSRQEQIEDRLPDYVTAPAIGAPRAQGRRRTRVVAVAVAASVVLVVIGAVALARRSAEPSMLDALVAAPLGAANGPPSPVRITYLAPNVALPSTYDVSDGMGSGVSLQAVEDGGVPPAAAFNASLPFGGVDLATLPTDPRALADAISAESGVSADSPLNVASLAVLSNLDNAPASVRSAAIGAIVELGGKVVEGPVPPTDVGDAVLVGTSQWVVAIDPVVGAARAVGWSSSSGGPIDTWLTFGPVPTTS